MNTNRKLFISVPGPSQQGRTSAARTTNMSPNFATIGGLVQGAQTVYDVLPEGVKRDAANAAKNKFQEMVGPKSPKSRSSNSNRRSGGSGNGRGGGSEGGLMRKHSSGYALSQAPNPKITSLDSGIAPNTYTSDYLDAIENECSPLHVSAALFNFPDYTGSRLYEYFLKIIAFDVQSKAQSNVGFNLRVDIDFTAEMILKAMNDLTYALQIYLYYKSIISYHSDPTNKNEGMIQLRAFITPNIMEDLYMLERRLSDTPVPPKLLELLRYLSGNYLSGVNQGSPMLKIIPQPSGPTMINASTLTDALDKLSDTGNNKVYTLLRRAVPNWNPKVIYDIDPNPVYDANFLTIFANLPFYTHDDGQTVGHPYVDNTDETIQYNSFTNALDGLAYSLTSVVVNGDTGFSFLPGLIKPMDANDEATALSRRSFYEIGETKAFYPIQSYDYLVRSRPETYIVDVAFNQIGLHLFGADKCLNVNAKSIRETSMKSVDYLMSLDMIKSSKPNTGSNPGRPNRR